MDLESFESGEISVNGEEHSICLQFELGIKAYLVSIVGVAACALLLLLKGVPTVYVEIGGALCGVLIGARLLYSLSNVRSWFTSIVLSTVKSMT